MIENPSKYSNTKISRFTSMRKEWISPRHKITQLADEDVFQISSKPKTQRDDKLSQVGNAVLQLSKLLLLRFVFFLEEHLIKDSYRLLYLGKLL